MKKLLLGLGLALVWSSALLAASRDAAWAKVEEAINKGLPKTAITNLEPILAGALKDKAWGEAAKALARKIVLEGNIQGNKPEEKITRLEAEITRAPKELVPLLDTILANWYWHYFQNNRWRFMRRTATAEAPGQDFTTWDLPRLFAEIDRQFTKALAAADTLKRTPIAGFNDLLTKGTLPDAYRPTLYDFIAHEALKFYTSGEQAAAKAEDAFELFADKLVYGLVPIFGPAEDFIAGKIERRAGESPTEKAFFLFRDLLIFHRNDTDPSAFADADLARLAWAYNAAFGEDKPARYKAALQNFAERRASHELSALALERWARVVQGEGDLVEARRLAQRGVNAHPASFGGKRCRNLIAEIEAKSAGITTERVWNAPVPQISVRYRNVTNVFFRAVAWDWSAFLDKKHSRPESLNQQERAALLAKAPALAWDAALPATADFKERTQELPAPTTLKPGFYFLIASHDRNFSDTDNVVTFTDIWVSELALVVRPHQGKIEGFVLAANSGEPLPNAEVMAWHLENNGTRVPLPAAVRTDDNGFFSFTAKGGRGSLLRARAQIGGVQQELGSMQDYWSYANTPPEAISQTVFFTDRALYRPGQTIQYKGIALRVDTEKDNYAVLPGQRVTVAFTDPNGKEIATAQHQCNDYGSFSGSFTAPRDRLMGQMTISVRQGPSGSAQISVEEYKRPKFQTTLDAPKVAAKLNDTVALTGRAENYTGAPVDSGLVKWRVTREVRWPVWWGWHLWRAPRAQGSQEIAHGTAATTTDGTFTITFTAKPDPSVAEKDEASFRFAIHADVTDGNGETRSADRSIHVGFAALEAALLADDWQTETQAVALKIKTTTLDGEAQAATGAVKVYRLAEPAQVQRAAPGGIHWRGEFGGDGKPDLSNPNAWELAGVAEEKAFTTDAEGNAKLEFKLAAGVYRALLETRDRFDKKVTTRLPLTVLKPDATKLGVKVPQLIASPKWSLEPGEEFMAIWGTGYDAGRAFIEIEHRNAMLERFWTKPDQTQQQIKRAVTEAMRGGFTLHVTQVRENRAYLHSRHIDVPWSNQNLDLKWEHFTSKLQPGQKETWTAVLTGPGAQKAAAEVVATLYDASLDQFQRHDWMKRFGFFRQDYSQRGADFANALKSFQQLRGQGRRQRG